MVTVYHNSIPQKNYVNVLARSTSDDESVGKEFVGCVLTKNYKVPYGSVVSCESIQDVRSFFGVNRDGADSNETLFAEKYFSYVSEAGKSPKRILFSRHCTEETDPYLMSRSYSRDLSAYRACKDVSIYFRAYDSRSGKQLRFVVNVNGLGSVDSLGGTGATSVVSMLNESFEASAGVGSYLRASVTDDRLLISVEKSLRDETDVELAYFYGCEHDSDGDIGELLGLTYESGVMCSDLFVNESSSYVTAGDMARKSLETTVGVTDGFGSFCFLDDAANYNLSAINTVASRISGSVKWQNDSSYDFLQVARVPIDVGNDTTFGRNLNEIVGERSGVHYIGYLNERGYNYEEALPMAILATMDLDNSTSVSNWMFCSNELVPWAVENEELLSKLDELRINYVGITQQIADSRSFYQPGVNSDGMLASAYCAESWLRDRISFAVIKKFLSKEIVSSVQPKDMVFTILPVMEKAVSCRMFQIPRNEISAKQKLYITTMFESEESWREVQNDGYCISFSISYGKTEITFGYKLAYYTHTQVKRMDGVVTVSSE